MYPKPLQKDHRVLHRTSAVATTRLPGQRRNTGTIHVPLYPCIHCTGGTDQPSKTRQEWQLVHSLGSVPRTPCKIAEISPKAACSDNSALSLSVWRAARRAFRTCPHVLVGSAPVVQPCCRCHSSALQMDSMPYPWKVKMSRGTASFTNLRARLAAEKLHLSLPGSGGRG